MGFVTSVCRAATKAHAFCFAKSMSFCGCSTNNTALRLRSPHRQIERNRQKIGRLHLGEHLLIKLLNVRLLLHLCLDEHGLYEPVGPCSILTDFLVLFHASGVISDIDLLVHVLATSILQEPFKRGRDTEQAPMW